MRGQHEHYQVGSRPIRTDCFPIFTDRIEPLISIGAAPEASCQTLGFTFQGPRAVRLLRQQSCCSLGRHGGAGGNKSFHFWKKETIVSFK